MDVNLEHDFLYNGCAVTPEGKLAILFNQDRLAVNIDDCLEEDKLTKALNNAPTASSSAMSYVARSSIETEWEQQAEQVKKSFAEILQTEVTLDPNFQHTYEALKAAADPNDNHWERNIGNFTRFYYEALASGLKSQKFDSDEMMREALVEAVEKGTVAFRVVEEGKMKALYNESVFEDGVLYMQVSDMIQELIGAGRDADCLSDNGEPVRNECRQYCRWDCRLAVEEIVTSYEESVSSTSYCKLGTVNSSFVVMSVG